MAKGASKPLAENDYELLRKKWPCVPLDQAIAGVRTAEHTLMVIKNGERGEAHYDWAIQCLEVAIAYLDRKRRLPKEKR